MRYLHVIGLACCLCPLPSYADPDKQAMLAMTVRVVCSSGGKQQLSIGSGFLVGDSGRFVVTNAHVVEPCIAAPVVLIASKTTGEPIKVSSKIVWRSKKSDLTDFAILSLDSPLRIPGAAFATSQTVASGDPVWAVGFPGAADKVVSTAYLAIPTLAAGQVSRVVRGPSNGVTNGPGLLQVTAAINPGSSGGPLFNEYGEVVGINSLKSLVPALVLTPNSGEGNINVARLADGEAIGWAQQADELLPALNSLRIDHSVRGEPHSQLTVWFHRDPITAAAILIVSTATMFLLALAARRQLVSRSSVAKREEDASQSYREFPLLVGVSGQYRGHKFPLSEELRIGRDPRRCNIVITDSTNEVSGVHCSIRYLPDINVIELTDHNSTNGTYANDHKVPSGRVSLQRVGDKFRIAQSDNYFQIRAG